MSLPIPQGQAQWSLGTGWKPMLHCSPSLTGRLGNPAKQAYHHPLDCEFHSREKI
jgi:hypothetical protein